MNIYHVRCPIKKNASSRNARSVNKRDQSVSTNTIESRHFVIITTHVGFICMIMLMKYVMQSCSLIRPGECVYIINSDAGLMLAVQ